MEERREINLICCGRFSTTQEHNQLPMLKRKMGSEIIMETLRDYLRYRNYNFRKVDCDPLRKIKRRIGYMLLEEFCEIVLAPLGHKPPDC